MSFKTILVPVEQHDLMTSTLETALLLARKFDSYIEGFALHVAIPAAYAMADGSSAPMPPSEQDIAGAAERTRGLFDGFMQEHGVPHGGQTTTGSSMSLSWVDPVAIRRARGWPPLKLPCSKAVDLS